MSLTGFGGSARSSPTMTYLTVLAVLLAAEPEFSPPPPPPPSAEAPPAAVATASEPEPSLGLGMRIPGAIMLGVGLANLASAAVCYTDFYGSLVGGRTMQNVCLVGSLVLGLGLSIPGVILTILGVRQRNVYLEWEKRTGASLGAMLAPGSGWASLTWRW